MLVLKYIHVNQKGPKHDCLHSINMAYDKDYIKLVYYCKINTSSSFPLPFDMYKLYTKFYFFMFNHHYLLHTYIITRKADWSKLSSTFYNQHINHRIFTLFIV